MAKETIQAIEDLLIEKARAVVRITRADIRVTVGPGWRDGVMSPETVCCFQLTWICEGREIQGPWIGWN